MQLSTFKPYVRYDFIRTDKDTEMVQAYNDMLMWVATRMPVGDYKYQSYINTTADTEDYPLPSTLVHLIHPIRLLEGSSSGDSGYPMEHISKERYDLLEPNPNRSSPDNTGQPTKYTIYSRSILVTPIPDSANYILEINWTKEQTDLSADADLPSLPVAWDEVLKWGVLERLYAGLGQLEESMFWGSKYHMIDQYGNDMPVGMCKTLFDIEEDREGFAIGQVKVNNI